MNKKAIEAGFYAILIAVLTIIVLAVMIFIIKTHISGQSLNILNIGRDVTSQAKGEKCYAFFLGQYCNDKLCDTFTEETVNGDFEDCKKKSEDNKKPYYCCRKVKDAEPKPETTPT